MINTQCRDKVKNGVTYVRQVASGLGLGENKYFTAREDDNLAEYIS